MNKFPCQSSPFISLKYQKSSAKIYLYIIGKTLKQPQVSVSKVRNKYQEDKFVSVLILLIKADESKDRSSRPEVFF